MTTKTTPTWFITGASSGFGRAFARYALDRGYNVVATARSVRKLEALAADAPERVLVHKLDVTVPADAEQAIAAAIQRFGRIDVLINNAGYGTMGAVEETPDAEFRAQMETNFFGALSVTRAVLPYHRRQRGGAIVNMSSNGGQMSYYKSCLPSQTPAATDQVLGVGDGVRTEFQLVKAYASGAQSYQRPILKPVAGTVAVALDGVPQAAGWTVDTTTGIVTFAAAPGAGVSVAAGFQFDVPVRFDTDRLDITLDIERKGSIASIPLLEIRPRIASGASL